MRHASVLQKLTHLQVQTITSVAAYWRMGIIYRGKGTLKTFNLQDFSVKTNNLDYYSNISHKKTPQEATKRCTLWKFKRKKDRGKSKIIIFAR